jgi:hypothetical protein
MVVDVAEFRNSADLAKWPSSRFNACDEANRNESTPAIKTAEQRKKITVSLRERLGNRKASNFMPYTRVFLNARASKLKT